MAKVTLLEAVNMALHHEMAADENVVCLGEDIGTNGGVFRATVGLKDKFGFRRVMDTPLAEGLIGGLTIGMASQGLRPVAEFQFQGFIFPAMEQIICQAARMRSRTRGRITLPLVYRAPFGGFIHAPEHHSESVEALFAHIPGLRVVIPSSPARAYGLLLAAIRSNDPVMFFEPKRIYRTNRHEVADDGQALPLDVAFILREGSDITLVSWGASVNETLLAADRLADEGINAEVIDLATIKPLDIDTIVNSVRKTGRLCIVHEAAKSFGVGAEIATQVQEQCFYELKAPIGRVAGYDVTMPYYQNEQYYQIHTDDVVLEVKKIMERSA
ncbi:alpha-ketoacid dehydrogenase subunit beta [Gallaecimonas pentaromativorans]|uniref:2-oxoisovalerate dehydrogenase subunit beta n=1 Tax=Gallaecimonas pentaromativorans TaxID=584787 RepID=A0A3N1PNE5_9GAMM|nr:alpha-ketoacid dehydrogenase subunit beta [Gallaecimonas pentaromativorans]MED5525998.1 alpha-ketoacid dehydrogenase subunit beta [Pseudomonadota bacterium]ROQ29689.1 pyruvate dehydrogenase E1 component beta subunit [Gallaecimonas pentaromativorans]